MSSLQTTAPPVANRINYHLRPMEPKDGPAYRDLMANSPETGIITIQIIFKEDPYEMLMKRRMGQIVVVAETPEGKVVGAASADARPVWFEKQAVQAVHLHGLLVAPEYRRRGVATALAQWRIRWAREHYGEGVLIFAEIQQGNQAAYNNALKWATGFGQPRESGFLGNIRQAQPALPGVTIREAVAEDYPEIAHGLQEYNRDVNFTRYVTMDRLRRNLEPIHGQVFRHRYVAVQDGKIVGGAVLSSHDPSVETHIIRAPLINRWVARLSGMIQHKDVLDGGEIDGIWFKPGYADTSHHLVRYLRHQAYPDIAGLNITVTNPKSFEALQLSRWQPHTIYDVAYLRPGQLQPYVEPEH